MNIHFPYMGEAFSLLCAIIWALAVILFKKSGEKVHPIALNLFKNSLALVLFAITLMLFGESIIRDVPFRQYALLLLSGVLGLGVSDTLLLKSLNLLGAGFWAILACLWAPAIITLSFIFLDERMSLLQLSGVVLIIVAILIVSTKKANLHIPGENLFWGIFWGVLAVGSGAVGIVIIKRLLEQSPILWVTEIRLIGGIISLMFVLLLHPRRKNIMATLKTPQSWGYTIGGSLTGAYLAMLVWLVGMKYTEASIASTLNQTNNIFIFIFAWLILKEPITRRRLISIILGVAGAFVVTFG
jgi:drug/metabolite transporter (DMT)-like permease